MKIGYGRVSTRDQHPDAQQDALERAGCEQVLVEKASGKLASRPQLDEALRMLRPGDQLVVTKLDRLGRSLRHLMDLSAVLAEREVDLVVLDQGIDTSTPIGRMFYAVIGAFAEFERELISERTRDGLAAARARGRTGGQRPKLRGRRLELARAMYDEVAEDGKRCYTVERIAEEFEVSRATIYRALGSVTSANGAPTTE